MARKPQARRQGGKGGTPAWAELLLGLFIGALGYFGYQQYRELTAPAPTEVPVPETADSAPKADDKGVEPPASGVDDGVLDTDYSFYDVLPGEETAAAPDETVADETAAAPGAGAAKRAADAEDLKARIALAGEAARVETAEVDGKTLHRVRMGPYTGEQAAAKAKRALADQGSATVHVKLPGAA